MSDYLMRELERAGVAVRDRSEVVALHGDDGKLEAVTLSTASAFRSRSSSSSSARSRAPPGSTAQSRRDRNGFVLTGQAAGADNLLETSVAGIFAAGDVRSGSTKRCAAAVGEGAMAVQFVHTHLTSPAAARR